MRFAEQCRTTLPIERFINDLRSQASKNRKKQLSPQAAYHVGMFVSQVFAEPNRRDKY